MRLSASRAISPKGKERGFLVIHEVLQVLVVIAQQCDDGRVGTIAQGDPDDFGWGTARHAEAKKVLVAGDEHAIVGDCECPDFAVGCAPTAEPPHVQRARVQVRQSWKKRLREVLVEQEAHGGLSGRNGEEPAFAFSGKGEAGEHIVVLELGEVGEELGLGHPAREIAENVTDGQAGASDARLAEPDGRVNGNALKVIHGNKIRSGNGTGKQGAFRAPSG